MANALTYMKNVGKSVAYSSAKVIKDMNPVIKDFTETNASAISGTYRTIRDLKKVTKRIGSSVKDSNYYKYGKNTFDNLMSDIKTGKFYNKERIDKYENDFSGVGEDFDFGSEDDFGFGSADDFGFDDSSPSNNEMMDIVGEKASNAVSNAVARSAEYIVQGTAESNRTLYNQMNIVYSGMQSSLSVINENISKFVEFSNEATMVHYENSKTFYEEITRLDNERNQYLKEIAEGVKQLNAPAAKRDSKEVTGYSDLITGEGALDIGRYLQQVKKNIKSSDGGITDMLGVLMDMSGGKGVASPISALMELGLEHVFKKSFGDALQNFNTSLSGLMGNALLALKKKGDTSGGIWSTLSNIFGIDTGIKEKIDPSAYEKGKIPFDGVTKKAITEVIPTYLSKILTAITGRSEDRFDYEKGEFVTIEQLRKELSDMTTNSAKRAASDLDWEVRKGKKSLSFRSKEEERQFDEDWEAIKQYMYKNQTSFNTRDKKLDGMSFGLKGGLESDKNVRRLQGLLDANPEVLKYADNMFRERESQSKKMRDLEASGAGALISLFNGSVPESTTKATTAKSGSGQSVAAAALSGSSVLNELIDIHKELSYIRLYGAGGGRISRNKGKNGKGPGNVPPSFDSFEIPRAKIKEEETSFEYYPTLSDEEVDDDIAKLVAGDKKKFGDRLKEAKGITGKISVFADSILGKVDEGIYTLVYGPKDQDGEPDEKKSFISSLLQGLKRTFQNFSDFLNEKILDPLKERFSGDKVKDFLKNSFEKVFKISFDEFSNKVKDKLFGEKDASGKRTGVIANFFEGFKSEMKGAFNWVKDSFKSAGKKVADFAGLSSVKTASGEAKAAENATIDSNISAAKQLKNLFQSKTSDIQEAATGLKRVNKTGLAVISEGEMIIPPDMNPFNISKRQKNERKIKSDLKSGIDSIFEFAEGTASADFSGEQDKTDAQDKLFEKFLSKNPELLKKYIEKKGSMKYVDGYIGRQKSKKQKLTKEDYERTPIQDRVIEEAGKVINSLKNTADTLGMTDKDKEVFKEKATKFISEVKEHGTTMAAGATIGAGVSLFTGLIGGPLLGAAVGAGVGLLTRSKTVQDFLFGNEEEGKDGKLPKKLVEGIKKYAPDMAKGGTIGGILAALPFIPGGPVAGLLVGSAIGFAKNNDNIQKMIWGEDLHRKEDLQKKLQTALPKMGLGAAVGLLAGPFGPMANILLGSALGFAADSDKFKNMIFGEEGEDGKRQGGLFGFIKEKILAPIENLFDPLKRRLEDLGESIKNSFKEFFKKNVVEPIDQFIKNTFLKPLSNMFKKVFGGVLGVAKKVVAKPFEWIGNLGTNMRIKDIKQGKARYMSAAEREDMRLAYGDARFRKVGPGKDQFAEFDKSMLNADKGQLSSAQQVLESIQGSYGDIGKLQKESHENIYNAFYHNQDKTLDSKEGNRFSRTVMRMVKSGDYEAAKKFVQDSKFKVSDETRSGLLKVIEDNANKLNMANKMRNNVTGATDEAFDLLQQSGINVDKGLIEKVQKGDKGARKTLDQMLTYIKNESGLRSAEEEKSSEEKKKAGELSPTEEATAKRHEEILNPVKSIDEKITEFLQKLTDYSDPSKYRIPDEREGVRVLDSDYEFDVTDTKVGKFTKGLNKVRGAKFDAKLLAKEKAGEIKEGIKEKTAEVKENLNEARDNSEFMNKHFGVRSKRKYYKVKRKIPTVLSEGETVVSETEGNEEEDKKSKIATAIINKGKDILSNIGDKAEEHAKGGIAGDGGGKPSGIMQLFKKMASSLSKMAGVALATAYKDGVNVDSVDSETDSKTFFSKIKSKFGKAKSVVTQFFDGHAVKFIKDKNGDLIPDSSSAENNEYEEFQDEKVEREKGILGALSNMPSMFGGLFKKVFGEKDEKEGNIFQKILDFFTGNGKGINLGSVLKNVIPLALVGLGLSGKLDDIASKLTGGLFGSKDANSGITAETPDGKNVELKTDEKGEPIKDADGNYVAVNGKTVSGDAKTRTTKSQATMSLSSRLKYNAVRGAVTGKGSIVGAVIKKNPITKPVVKAAGKAKSGLGKVANVAMKAAKDPAAASELTDKISDMITKWTGAMKKVPKLAKFADKLDDLGRELLEVIAKKLPKAGASLIKIKDILGKVNIYVMIAMAVIDFTTGFQDASTTLKIRKENVTIPQKILCGLLRTVKNFIPVIGSFIPDSLVTDLFIKYVAGWFKIDVSALKKQRDEAQKELDDYNAENGTNYTWAEYNKKVLGNYTWTEQVWNGASKVGKGIAKGAKAVGKGIAKGAKKAWKGVKKAGSWVADKASGVVEGVKKGVGKVADFVSDKFDDAKDIGSFALAKVKDRVKEIITGKNIESNLTIKEDDPNGKIKKIIYNVINYATALPLGMSKIIHGIFDKVIKPIMKGIKEIGSGVIGSIKNQFTSAWKGDLKAAYTESSDNADTGNVLVDGISKLVNSIIKVPLTMPTLLTAGIGLVVRNFKDIVAGIKAIGSGVGKTVKNQFVNAWKGNFKEIFTDKSGNTETGNGFVDGISGVINTVSKLVLAVPTLMTARIGGMVRAVKGAIDLFKTIGPGIGTTVKNQFANAWKGNFKEIFTDKSGNTETGNKLVDGISGVINTVSKIVLAVPTLMTAKIGGIVRGVKTAIDLFKTIGPGIGTAVKNQFKNAWSGNFKEIFTDKEGNTETGNKLVDGISGVINTVSKIVLAVPTLMTAKIGGIVRGVKTAIGFFKQIGPGIGTTVKNQFKHAWNGDIGAIFTDNSGNANTGNKLVDTSSAVINTVSKIVLAVPTLLTAGVGSIVTGVKNTIEAIKVIGPGIGGTVKNMFSYAAAGDIKSIFTDSSENAESGNKLVDGISKVVNNIVKIPLAVPALITAGVTSAVKGITKLVNGIKKAGTLSEKDKGIIKDSKEGKVSLFSKKYWTVNTELDGIGGAFNKFVSITRKIFNIPAALIGWIKDKMPFDDFITGIKDFFGLDDSETKEKKNGSGSGLVGRGSGSQSKEQASVSDGTFISQVDPKYRNKSFNISKDTEVQTLGNTGCAPAAAAMAVNATYNDQRLSMEQASKNALKYKVTNDGVNASYFNDEFSRHGLSAEYIVSNDKNARTQEIINRLSGNTRVVLMGQDSYNKSKAHSPFGPNPHYVVANGLSKDGKYIYINDPEASTPNVKYPTDKVLGSSTLGISAQAAMGSKLILNKVKGFVGRGAYGPETTEYKVWTKLRSAGYSEVQAAAIMGNIKHESGFRANAIEKGSGVGFGLCQWSYGRRTAIENYAKSIGKPASDIGVQLDFLIAELTPGGGAGGYAKYQLMTTTYEGKKWQKDLFNTTTDVETATKAFCYCWERPNEKYAHIDRRVASAKEYFKEFTGVDAPYTGDTSGSTSEGGNDFISGVGKIFNLLASKYGLNVGSTDSSGGDSSGGTTQTAEGNVSSNADHAAKQKALVEKMYSVQGKLKYAQGNAKFPGSRNPEDGSGDCSSTVQWAYKNIIGVDPGSWTGAQRTDGDTYTVATSTADESKLQLGDLLLKDGHVEMYAGNGKMIGHGGGNDGKTKGPTIKNLDKSGKYNLVRRWVGFKGSGSGLVGRGSDVHPEPSYNMALKHIKTDEMTSVLPFGMNTDEISQNKSSVMQYNNNKLSGSTSNKPVAYTGRASQLTNDDKRVVKKSSNESLLLEAINSIIKLLVKMVTNTDKLNNIFKLLGEYIDVASNKNVNEESKQATLIAKQNLLNSLQSKSSDSGTNAELMKLIENVERIAME